MRQQRAKKTSWEPVSDWYGNIVGEKGHYYHRKVVLPNVMRLLDLKKDANCRLLDLACGQGVLARQLPKGVEYWGVDVSRSLITEAKKQCKGQPQQQFRVGDVTKTLKKIPGDCDWVTMILALQDIADAPAALANAAQQLKTGGRLLLVLNHPCFRIPRQSHWGVDEGQKLQYRRMDRYLSPLEVPIRTKPSKGKASPVVYSHHRPLSFYIQWLSEAGLLLETMEEWVSDKKSTGSKAAMENRARAEFPLFICLVAKKVGEE